MLTGAHAIIYSADAEADRAFFRDVLELENVDVGGGWLIFALPPAEMAVHPAPANGRHELYLMCDDVAAFVSWLADEAALEAARLAVERGLDEATARADALADKRGD